MFLITDTLIEILKVPELHETEDIEEKNRELLIRYMEKNTEKVWYLCEYSKEEKVAFGYVMNHTDKDSWKLYSLEEMEAIHTIERDEEFIPMQFRHLKS